MGTLKKQNGKSVLVFLLALGICLVAIVLAVNDSAAKPRQISIIDYNESIELDSKQRDINKTGSVAGSTAGSSDNDLFVFDDESKSLKKMIPSEPEILIKVSNNETIPYFSSQDFLDIFDIFESSQNIIFSNKYIYQIDEVDDYIKNKAQLRGYKQRSFADESDIISFENIQTRAEVKKSYISMRNAMSKDGIRLHFVSGYRSSNSQRSIFINKLNIANPLEILTGIYDEKINEVLTVSSIPGYSKHHSGYAADFGCGNDYLVYSFAETECYEWLSADNFKNSRMYGFIPSYPNNGGVQGPDPEPWEFVWVGSELLK